MSVRVVEASNWENRLASLSSSFQQPHRKALAQLNDSTSNYPHQHYQQHQKEQEPAREHTFSDGYYYAPASPTLTGSATMAQHYQPRQPPTLNIAAAAAATSSSSSATSIPLSEHHPHHQHHHQQQPSPSSYHASHHHHQSMQAQHVPPYSAPAMSVGGGGGSYYANSTGGLTTPATGHSNAQASASAAYNSSMAMHQSAMQHNSNGASNGSNASGASLPFMLSSTGAPSQQAQHQSFSPVSSAGYNGGAGAGSGYAGASHFHQQQQFSAPHSMHSFPHRITNSSSSFDGITGGAGASSYDFHQHVGHGVGLVDSGHGLLSAHGFDANGLLPLKSKRKQVKNACVNCQKACKRCDEGRPCSRCVKYGLTATCMDSARKERKRGIKRGPYKRRATTGSQPNGYASASSSSSATLTGLNGSSFGQGHGSVMSGHHSHHQMHHHQAQQQQQQQSYYHQQPHHSMLGHGQSSITSPVSQSEGHGKTDIDASSSVAGEISPVMYLGSSFDHTAPSSHHSVGDNTHHFAGSRSNAGSAATLNAAPMSYEASAPSGSSPVPYGRELYAQGASVTSTTAAPSSSLSTAGTMMQPPPNRPSSHTSMRTDYDRPSGAFSSGPYGSSLYSNAPLASGVASTEARLRSLGTSNGAVSTSGNFSQHQPASAPPSSANFSLTNNGNSKPSPSSSFQQRNVTVPSLFSPSSVHPSANASNNGNSASSATPSSGFMSASSGSLADGHTGLGQQHRLYSEGTLATLSNGSGTSGSSIHSPRTPVGLGTVHSSSTHGELGLLNGASSLSSSTSSPGHEGKLMMGAGVDSHGAQGGVGSHNGAGQTSSYVHHPSSSTLSSLNPMTAGAFLNPPSSNAGQGFTLHIPHSARYRGGSGNGAGSTSTDASAARPRSAYDNEEGLPSSYNGGMGGSNDALMHKAAAAASAGEGDFMAHKSIDSQPGVSLPSPASSRYQLPSPRQDPLDGRVRSGLAKLESSGAGGDVASATYGAA